jgi:hypothetical protein
MSLLVQTLGVLSYNVTCQRTGKHMFKQYTVTKTRSLFAGHVYRYIYWQNRAKDIQLMFCDFLVSGVPPIGAFPPRVTANKLVWVSLEWVSFSS